MITQKQIAQELGLSIITVSRALRSHPDLAEDTREKVLNKAIELGYPKIAPRTAQGVQAKRIGVVPYQSAGTGFFESEFHHRIFTSLETECQKQGVEIVLQFHRSGEIPLCVKNRTVDAVCLLGRYTPDSIRFADEIPTLAVSSFIRGLSIPRVVADNVGGSAEVTEHLISLGHRKILFLGAEGDSGPSIYGDRADGYRMAMARHGLTALVRLPENGTIPTEGDLKGLEGFTAVQCCSDGSALTLLNLLETHSIAVPQKLSLAGFDDITDSSRRGLTTYGPDWAAMGRLAAFLLVARPQELLHTQFQMVVPGKLLPRRTTTAL